MKNVKTRGERGGRGLGREGRRGGDRRYVYVHSSLCMVVVAMELIINNGRMRLLWLLLPCSQLLQFMCSHF